MRLGAEWRIGNHYLSRAAAPHGPREFRVVVVTEPALRLFGNECILLNVKRRIEDEIEYIVYTRKKKQSSNIKEALTTVNDSKSYGYS